MPQSPNIRLLVSCADARGIICAVTTFIGQHNGNIVDLDQHADPDTGAFFMRIEIEHEGFSLVDEATFDEATFGKAFQAIAEQYELNWRIDARKHTPKVAVFATKEDHCLSDLLWRWSNSELGGEIVMVISNHEHLRAQTERMGLPFHHVPVTADTKAAAEAKAFALMDEAGVDLVVLARYMQVLSADFVERYAGRVINIHHSFLPAFAGAKPYHRAHERGVKLIGATAHYVTADLDEGPIIAQETARVNHRDNVADMIRKGRDLERLTLAQAVRLHLDDRVLIVGNRTVVFE